MHDHPHGQTDHTPDTLNPRRAMLAGIGGLAAGAFLASAANAGPLDPPPGPIAPTGKTLTEVEPRIAVNSVNTPGSANALFRITQPGSYYLTGNITAVAGKHGIEIAASGVTLDLSGFDLVGIPGMGDFDAIRTSLNALANIAILNGSIRNWGGDGIDLRTFGASDGRVEGVLARNNTGSGIRVSSGFVITHCTASFNILDGVNTDTDCTITNCLATGNQNFGIFTALGVTIFSCSARFNGAGGIAAESTSTIANCSVSSNFGSGIRVADGSFVTDCASRVNALDGIECSNSCVIRNNNCSSNGSGGNGAGVHVTGIDNRIEGNNCSRADRGIDVDGAGNIIIRNTCSGNTINYAIAANNRYGPIINITATGTAAVNGSSASGTLTSADPHANFAY